MGGGVAAARYYIVQKNRDFQKEIEEPFRKEIRGAGLRYTLAVMRSSLASIGRFSATSRRSTSSKSPENADEHLFLFAIFLRRSETRQILGRSPRRSSERGISWIVRGFSRSEHNYLPRVSNLITNGAFRISRQHHIECGVSRY
jgi:hypothetical protein